MEILSHRGYWVKPAEKNRTIAFRRSFHLGYGTETDVRDFNGQLVISHGVADANALSADKLFQIYNKSRSKNKPTLALNVKADGLQNLIKSKLEKYSVENYFLFDMSIPDLLNYKKAGLIFFIRMSEYEPESDLIKEASGVWFDSFKEIILNKKFINSLLVRNKKICFVSPELHARKHLATWSKIKRLSESVSLTNNFLLCTDLPIDATRFFYGK